VRTAECDSAHPRSAEYRANLAVPAPGRRAIRPRRAAALKKFNKQGEVKVYSGCSHGFFNDTRPDIYSATDAKDAWARSLKLFDQNLKH
jgi:dienelactone hydrolase